MRNKNLFQKMSLLLVIGLTLFVVSCKKDKTTAPKPVASFTDVVTNLQVVFTNTSTNATTYAWTFGDGGASTETSPTYTYTAAGTYWVKLTATGEGGTASDSVQVTVTAKAVILPKMGSDFSFWDSIPALISLPDTGSNTLNIAKLWDSKDSIYVFIQAKSTVGPVMQLYIDADNDSTLTGWNFWNFYANAGIEYINENVIVAFTGTSVGLLLKLMTHL